MAGRIGPYEVLLVVAAVATATVAIYTWRRRDKPGAEFLAAVLTASAGWSGLSLLGSLTRGEQLALVSAKLVYVFVPVAVAGIFLFTLTYTRRENWLGQRLYAVMAIEPILVNLAVWTNDIHGMFWTVDGLSETSRIGWDISFGLLFNIHIAYSYLLMAVATLWLFQFAFGADRLYRRQVFGLLASLIPPWVGNVLFVLTPLATDPTPIAIALTSLGLTWSILRARLLDIAPIARAAVIETIADAVIVVDDTGQVVDVNAAARELFDMSDTVIGTDIATAMSGQQPVGAEIKALLNDSESNSTELQIGEKFYTIDVAPLDDVRGEFIGHALLVHDVTERKDRELQLQRRNKQLDRFAGVISHDLRNPLHVASGALKLARETGEDKHFDRVERAHQRMERLIEDLLTLAREGQQIDEQEPVSLAEIARTSWDTVATDGATLAIDSDTTIEADPNRFQQLLENLYRNSVEHAGSDVTVRVAPTEDGFLVEDDGSGLPPAVREAVLEASYSAERSGPGIGLMIVRHVADAHGWSLSIENGDTGGAQFRFHTDGDADPAKKSNGD